MHLESLTGSIRVTQPLTFPGRGTLYRDDRFVTELRGELTLDTAGDFTVTAEGPASDASLDALRSALRLEVVYAKVGEGLPGIEAATPMINSYGLLRAGLGTPNNIQVAGIRMPERTRVTNFEKGLYIQAGDPNASFAALTPAPRTARSRRPLLASAPRWGTGARSRRPPRRAGRRSRPRCPRTSRRVRSSR